MDGTLNGVKQYAQAEQVECNSGTVCNEDAYGSGNGWKGRGAAGPHRLNRSPHTSGMPPWPAADTGVSSSYSVSTQDSTSLRKQP